MLGRHCFRLQRSSVSMYAYSHRFGLLTGRSCYLQASTEEGNGTQHLPCGSQTDA